MANHNFYIQYHNADKLGYFPTDNIEFNSLVSEIVLDDTIKEEKDWIYTSKRTVLKAMDSMCFLIVGKTENKFKNYYLWCYFKIKYCKETTIDIVAGGTGKDLKHPILLNNLPEFDSFKKFCGNFGIGFQNINNHSFFQILLSCITEIKENSSQTNRKIFLIKEIQELHNEMMLVKPERKVQEIEKIIRNDKKIVSLLKELVGYKCQFPNCNSNILTAKGTSYVEVAHIKAVAKGGQSILGNLLVLCPNHHKEFDLGKRDNFKVNINMISGVLNEKVFEIDLSKNYSYKIE